MPQRRSLADTVWAQVEKTDRCWLWRGALYKTGYGKLHQRPQMLRAHRVSYELHVGPIPENMAVCNRCDNPRCVRPDQLSLGSLRENTLDMLAMGSPSRRPNRRHPQRSRPASGRRRRRDQELG